MCLQFYERGHTQLPDEQIINIELTDVVDSLSDVASPASITWKYSASEMIINHGLNDAV